jgi:head-tail adaptor
MERHMREVLSAIEQQTSTYEQHPLFEFLRDEGIDPVRRLAFAPSAAHYVLTFRDFCQHVLREEPARDRIQELVNAQTYEEAEHARWFIADLAKLGHDPLVRFSQALEFVWGDETVKSRMLSYQLCRMALRADSLTKLVLIHCVEATAEVTIRHVMSVGKEWTAQNGKSLEFFGATHEQAEAHHGIWEREAKSIVGDIRLHADARRDLLAMVRQAFEYFTEFATELLTVSQLDRRLHRA